LAVAVAYGAFFGVFAWELATLKAVFNAFGVGAVAYGAELVFACYAASVAVWAVAFGHFWADFAGDSAYSSFQQFSPKRLIVWAL